MPERNFVTNPYSDDEKRVVAWIHDITKGTVGAGDDPIGFLMASHAMINQERLMLRDEVLRLAEAADESYFRGKIDAEDVAKNG